MATLPITRTWPRTWETPAQVAFYLALYLGFHLLLAWSSFVRPLAPSITPWNPQAGLTLALLVWRGPRWLPAAAIATFLAEGLIRIPSQPLLLHVAMSLWVACGYAVMGVVIRSWRIAIPMASVSHAARLATTVTLGTAIVAAGYVGLLVAAGVLPADTTLKALARHWIGDLNGILTVAPLLIAAGHWRELARAVTGHRMEILAQFASIALTLVIIFMLPTADQLRFFALLFVPLIWIALRWGWPGSILAALAIQIGFLIASQNEVPTPRFTDLQFLMLTLSLTALLLGAVVSERAGVLEQMAIREAEQRAVLAMAPDAVLAVDALGRIEMTNAAALRLFGERAECGRLLAELLPGLQLISDEGRVTLESQRADSQPFPAEIAWARLDPPANRGYLVTVRDATERRNAEQQLREHDAALARAMRFAAAGELASALAHELNQPITALVSYVRASKILADRQPEDQEHLQDTLGKAAHEAIRASEVLRRLRNFYQGGAHKREAIDLGEICTAVVDAFQERLRRHNASLNVSIDPDIPTFEGDATQVEIALHNLLANAIDAVREMPEGRRLIVLSASRSQRAATVRVDDSGPGMLPELRDKLFEPFVTSKPDGMGLGLAISRSLIRARGGELSCTNAGALGGASFTMFLPFEFPTDSPTV